MEFQEEGLKDSKYMVLWHDSPDKPEVLPALSQNEECELLIVGGGFTGLWAALQAKEQKPDLDIILIEGSFVGYGASGRNGGMIHAHLAHGDNNTDYHFPGEADRIYDLGIQNMEELLATLEKYNIDAEYECVGETSVATYPNEVEDLREEYEEAKEEGMDVTWYDKDEMQREVNSPTYLAGLRSENGVDGVVHPAK